MESSVAGTVPPTSVGVIGAGVSGLAMGLRLQRMGVPFTIFEKGGEVGGTWRENRYPGLTIDVPSPLYTFKTHRNPGWRRWMPRGEEILDYHRDVATRSGLRDHIRFNSEVVAADWTGSAWDVRTADGGEHRFRVLVCASGFLHHPSRPRIEGLGDFAGTCVHSAQWRDDIVTRGRRVGVVGTGSTGVQLVTELAGSAAHVTLFQRTAQWVFPSVNFPIPRLARRALARRPGRIDAIAEGVERFADWMLGGAAAHAGRRRRVFDAVARLHLRSVHDPELRAALTPSEEPLCKRPVLSSGFYRAVQRPDVTVVPHAIERVRPTGVVAADGRLHELDVLILATGFQSHQYMRPIAITGEGGRTLDEAWADGPHGYRTVALTGFPNLFMIMGPHSPLVSISIHASAEMQADYVAQMVDALDQRGVAGFAPTQEATDRWLETIRAGMPGTVWASGCSSWYLGAGQTPVLWPYDRRRWRELLRTPDLDDYDARPAPAAPGRVPASAQG